MCLFWVWKYSWREPKLCFSQHTCITLDELEVVINQQQDKAARRSRGVFSGNLVCDLDGRLCDLRKERPRMEEAEGVAQTAQIYGVRGKRGIFYQHEWAASD